MNAFTGAIDRKERLAGMKVLIPLAEMRGSPVSKDRFREPRAAEEGAE